MGKPQKEDAFAQFAGDMQKEPTADEKFVYFGNAVFVSILPVYLFRSVVGMSLPDHWLYFLLVTAGAVALLGTGYHKVSYWAYGRLGRQYLTESKKQAVDDQKRALASLISKSFSLAYSNALFLFLVVAFGFFIFGRTPAPFNYVLAVLLAAGIVNIGSPMLLRN
eukprot:c6757_g1_i1.p1 GENE.c6757_g1_i1~~c6757_g1_i1.p1  ORF type:complete len:173 (-),score=39.94 c6757_g1_i1:103-597(-)